MAGSATISTEQYARLLGTNAKHLYELAARGQTPVAPLRVGRSVRFPLRPVLDSLGLTELPPDLDG